MGPMVSTPGKRQHVGGIGTRAADVRYSTYHRARDDQLVTNEPSASHLLL